MKLTALQLTALQAFAGIGGSAYGPKSRRPRITRGTARQLEARGLAVLTEETLDGEIYQWGAATEAGRRELVARGVRPPAAPEYGLGYMQGRGAPVGCGG